MDEFGEPFHVSCAPVEVDPKLRLFSNQLNMNFAAVDDPDMQTFSIKFVSENSAVELLLQMNLSPLHNCTTITNLVCRIKTQAINQRFNTNY